MAWLVLQLHARDYVASAGPGTWHIVPGMSAITATETWQRRAAYLRPKQPIVTSLVPIEHARIWCEFSVDTGIDRLVSSIMCPVPIPEYPLPRRRPGAKANMLWHPFLWLPAHIAERRNEAEVADDDLYALRVALEVDATGLYDRHSGTWLDVCSTVGVDLDDPNGIARAQAWLDGAPDPAFDDIDLTDWTHNPQDPFWASDVAAANLKLWSEVVWYEGANFQAETVAQLASDTTIPAEELQGFLAALAGVSAAWFERVPPIGSSRLPGRPSLVLEAIEERLKGAVLPESELRSEIIPALSDAFLVIKDAFHDALDKLTEDDDEAKQLLAEA